MNGCLTLKHIRCAGRSNHNRVVLSSEYRVSGFEALLYMHTHIGVWFGVGAIVQYVACTIHAMDQVDKVMEMTFKGQWVTGSSTNNNMVLEKISTV